MRALYLVNEAVQLKNDVTWFTSEVTQEVDASS